VLVLLPASDAKRPVADGPPLDPAGLSFPELAPTRAAVLTALLEVSGGPDAPRRLSESPGAAAVIRRNLELRDAPTTPAGRLYSGVLYDALGLDDLDAGARRRARRWIVMVSALWGAVRPEDRVPSYRLNMCGRLPGLGHLPDVWRPALGEVLPAAAGRGLVVDCRSSEYATAWRPSGELAERTLVVRVVRDLEGRRGSGSHAAKAVRGLLVRRIVTDGLDPRRPEALAEGLGPHFAVGLRAAAGPARSWVLDVVEPPPAA
jgi:cytoplasmic iron level regulating protein YaaA (DUF328/UPF0246 family)